jgi:pimeloyl-ACP methyl ester carboxylesterase
MRGQPSGAEETPGIYAKQERYGSAAWLSIAARATRDRPSCVRVCAHPGMLRRMPAAVIAEDLSIEYETFGVRLGVLTALGISRAHVVGSSMGGMIAQTIAIEHPERVLTLTSMMSTTGEPEYGQSAPEAMTALLTPPPADREGYIEAIETSVIWRSNRHPEMVAARMIAAESYDRCYYPEGVNRQLAAMIASGPRAEGLRRLDVPTLVIHGLNATLIAEW